LSETAYLFEILMYRELCVKNVGDGILVSDTLYRLTLCENYSRFNCVSLHISSFYAIFILMTIEDIALLCKAQSVRWTSHILERMFRRGIRRKA